MTTSKRAVLALCILGFTMYLAGGITTPSIAYIAHSYPEFSEYTVSTLITMPGIIALIVSFFVGPLVLKFNKKYLLMFSVSMTLIYFSVFSFAGGRGPLSLLMVAAGFLGIHRGAGSALVNSIIGEFVPPEKRAQTIALTGSVMQAGSGLIAIIAGWIAAGNDGADWPQAHYLGFLSIITLAVFAFLMPKRPAAPVLPDSPEGIEQAGEKPEPVFETIKQGFRRIPRRVYLIMTVHCIYAVCMIAISLYTSLYVITVHELGTSVEAGLVISTMTFISVAVGMTYFVWGKLLGRWIVPVGYVLSIFGFIVKMAVTSHIAGAFIAAMIIGIGWNLTNPYVSSQVMSLSPQKMIPISISIHLGIQNLGMFLAPHFLRVAGGVFGGGVNGAYTVAIIVIPLCALAAVFLFAKKPRGTLT
ncbi:MAG: MFS transporter [Oscillospiraceae bacterium]|nr:MFS transporter [Oscillospiraceae bacterium]